MRILHVSQPTTEGTAAVVLQLAVAGRDAGHDIAVATPGGPGLPGQLRELGIAWHDLEMTRAPSGVDLRAVLRLRKLLGDFDVVHLHSSKAGAVGRLAVAAVAKPPAVVFTPHGWSWYVGGRMATAYRAFERWAVRRTDAIVAVSRKEVEDGEDVLGRQVAASGKIRLIQNGVDVNRFSPSTAPRDRGLIVCVGRLSRQKGQDRLIKAFASASVVGARLALVGDGPDRRSLERLAVDLGVADRVEFCGIVDPMPFFHAAEVVAMPSRWEGLSIAMLEAMATGNAIVYTESGGVDVLRNVGLHADGESEDQVVASLAGVLANALRDPRSLEESRLKARAVVEGEHSFDAVNAQYLELWAWVAGNDRSGRVTNRFGRGRDLKS